MNSQNLPVEKHQQATLIDGSHAIVIGGSLAGLLAARVLAGHFNLVTIVERDRLPEEPVARPGVPQARHLHALLVRGRRILEELFPGFGDEMRAAGAHAVDIANDFAWMTPGGWGVNFPSELQMLSFTRDLLDSVVRRRVRSIPNVRFVEEAEVTGLLTTATGKAVNGVRLKIRSSLGARPGEEERIQADLVVDASGRTSKMPDWLTALGYEAPTETVINAHLGYASRLYEIPGDFNPACKGLYIQAAPPRHTRAGILICVEGNRWIVTLGGGDRDYPPTDEEGFLEFARSLRDPSFYNAIKNARPLTSISGYRFTENRRRHYERLTRWPEALLVLGDGACAFNPVYGQGMTTAALGAQLLDRALREQKQRRGDGDLSRLARSFQKRLAKLNADPWTLATGEDYRYRSTEGGSPGLFDRLMHRYINHVFQLSTRSVTVRHQFLQVQGMLKPPTALFHPRVLLRVVGHSLSSLFQSARRSSQSPMNATALPLLNDSISPPKF
jgi:2-polyprenyl-6-methoxyphenol hydroxylase-like FAD-dependent oxidoreductase